MHFALRRYAEPPRDFVRFFSLGLFVGLLVFATVIENVPR